MYDKPINIDDEFVQCPHCGSDFLHHDRVEAFFRHCEDSERGIYSMTAHHGNVTGTGIAENPSARRDGVRIGCWCEECRGRSAIILSQHKGHTLIWTECHD